jgi:hypothetical protein
MKFVKNSLAIVLALAVLPLIEGCAVLVAGTAVAGATYGTVKYVSNTLQVTQETSLDKAWTAAQGAVKELQLPVYKSKKDGMSARLEARNIDNQLVVIQLSRKAENLTQIEITVGTFDSEKNRDREQLIYDKLKARL